MTDTTFASDDVAVVQTAPFWSGVSRGAVSWSAVIAGALAAIAVSIIVIALGSGIGLSLASPFSASPSAETLTIMGAVWLVFAQAIGFATGGYLAGRLRTNPGRFHTSEVKFRDGANGLIVWAIGVVVTSLVLVAAADKVGSAAANAASTGAAALSTAGAANQAPSINYYTDSLLRTPPQASTAAAGGTSGGTAATGSGAGESGAANANSGATNGNGNVQRQEINRILLTALSPSGMSNDDRTYLAQLVSARTGMSTDQAQQRVDDVVNRAKANATQVADAARKAAEYFSFWTFMSLLFGAVCAALGGVLGGELRDEFATQRAVPTVPR